jgi:hypothetical protein
VPMTWKPTSEDLTVTYLQCPAISGVRRPLVLTPVLTTGRPSEPPGLVVSMATDRCRRRQGPLAATLSRTASVARSSHSPASMSSGPATGLDGTRPRAPLGRPIYPPMN